MIWLLVVGAIVVWSLAIGFGIKLKNDKEDWSNE